MSDQPISILLIEDSPGDVLLIRELLAEAREISFGLVQVDWLLAGYSVRRSIPSKGWKAPSSSWQRSNPMQLKTWNPLSTSVAPAHATT
jgi:hypothetical protein